MSLSAQTEGIATFNAFNEPFFLGRRYQNPPRLLDISMHCTIELHIPFMFCFVGSWDGWP